MCFQGKCKIQIQRNGEKHFGSDLGPLGPNLDCQIFLFSNLALPVTRYHVQLSSCKISEKADDTILRNFSDGQMVRRTDRGE